LNDGTFAFIREKRLNKVLALVPVEFTARRPTPFLVIVESKNARVVLDPSNVPQCVADDLSVLRAKPATIFAVDENRILVDSQTSRANCTVRSGLCGWQRGGEDWSGWSRGRGNAAAHFLHNFVQGVTRNVVMHHVHNIFATKPGPLGVSFCITLRP